MSFVNNICTSRGGSHVKYVVDQITAKLSEHIEKENRDLTVRPNQIKDHIWIFINCLIENPIFDSNKKEFMTLKQASFGSECVIDDDFIKRISEISLIKSLVHDLEAQEIKNINKLHDAVNAGTRHAPDCTLVLTEGDSAKASALSGFDVVGHNNWGVYPLKGKPLNVRNVSMKQISENKEVQELKRILGLQHDKTYESVDGL